MMRPVLGSDNVSIRRVPSTRDLRVLTPTRASWQHQAHFTHEEAEGRQSKLRTQTCGTELGLC